jgi:uncharacterized membrane protein (DUF2068 family)
MENLYPGGHLGGRRSEAEPVDNSCMGSGGVDNPSQSSEHGHDPTLQVLRGIATFEVTKGMIVLLAAVGVLFLVHRDPWDMADSLLELLHISPDHHFAQVFLDWADTLTAAKLMTVAAGAGAYSLLRFVEAYGLWYARTWAEWIALISGAIYLPFEIYSLVHHESLFHAAVLVINLAIVVYMAYVLKKGGSLHQLPAA